MCKYILFQEFYIFKILIDTVDHPIIKIHTFCRKFNTLEKEKMQ